MHRNQLLQGVLWGVGMLAACSSPATTPPGAMDMAMGTGGGGEKPDMAQPPPPPPGPASAPAASWVTARPRDR